MSSTVLKALAIQTLALVLACFVGGEWWMLFQPALALLLAFALRQPWWWLIIHLAFMPALLLAQRFEVAPYVWLLLFILAWLVFGRVDRSRVPLYLSSRKAITVLTRLVPENARVLDIGAGTGTVLLALCRRVDLKVSGIEHAWLPWLWARSRIQLAGAKADLRRGDMMRLDWKDFDVVYAFLSPAMMPAVWQKARQELASGALLVSNSFPIEEAVPDQVIELGQSEGARLYLWQMR